MYQHSPLTPPQTCYVGVYVFSHPPGGGGGSLEILEIRAQSDEMSGDKELNRNYSEIWPPKAAGNFWVFSKTREKKCSVFSVK